MNLLLAYKTAGLVLAGVLLRDLWCWCAAKVFCWRKRRQTQRHARQQRLAEQVSTAHREQEARVRNVLSNVALAQYPFVIDANTHHAAMMTARRIYSDLRSGDKRRFFAPCATHEEN